MCGLALAGSRRSELDALPQGHNRLSRLWRWTMCLGRSATRRCLWALSQAHFSAMRLVDLVLSVTTTEEDQAGACGRRKKKRWTNLNFLNVRLGEPERQATSIPNKSSPFRKKKR